MNPGPSRPPIRALAICALALFILIPAARPSAARAVDQVVAIDFNRTEPWVNPTQVTTGRLEQVPSNTALLTGQLGWTRTYQQLPPDTSGPTPGSMVISAVVTVNFPTSTVVSASGTISALYVATTPGGSTCGSPTSTISGVINGGTYVKDSYLPSGTLSLTGTTVQTNTNFVDWVETDHNDAPIFHCREEWSDVRTGPVADFSGTHVFASAVTVSIADAVELEGGSGSSNVLAFVVSLSAPAPAGVVTVAYGTSDGSAQAGTDYQVSANTLSFAVGETAKTVVVPINGDPDIELDETLTVTLSAPTGATIAHGTGTGTILNDDLATVDFDWTMPERFGLDADGNSLIDYYTTAAAISPATWRVDFTYGVGGNCDPSHRLVIKIDAVVVVLNDPALIFVDTATCRAAYAFPAEALYEVSFEIFDSVGLLLGQALHHVTVQDWLIISLGDSVASGEGTPDIPGTPVWENRQCHRSASAGPAQAAIALERADPKTSVTFVHLACSGASVFEGVLARYRGQEPGPWGAGWLPPQVDVMDSLVGTREIDAVTVSTGANDVRFSNVVIGCFIQQDCHLATTGNSMLQFFNGGLALLPGNYDALGLTLRQPKYDVPPERTYITEYFDAMRDQNGGYCDEIILEENRNLPILGISGAEAQWASTDMMVRLNHQVAAGASRNGWKYVGGIFDAFRTHGYCSNDRWIVQLIESLADQRNKDGTLHPNEPGHAFYAGRLAAALTADFYTNADLATPRPPR